MENKTVYCSRYKVNPIPLEYVGLTNICGNCGDDLRQEYEVEQIYQELLKQPDSEINEIPF